MFDIANQDQLIQYLDEQRIFTDVGELYVRYFTGGVSATVALAAQGDRAVIVKQALSRLKVADNWECDPGRMAIEKEALDVYARLVPSATPAPISYDSQNHILIRDAAPENCPMWKTNLLEGLLDFEVARETIEALSTIHNGTANDDRVAGIFADSGIFYSLRISPYIERVAGKYPQLLEASKTVVAFLMNERIALIHGDFSPKNILVDGRNICILDHEVAYYGHPCFDLAFFFNHFMLKTVKNKQYGTAYLDMLQYMRKIYFNRLTCLPSGKMESDTVRTLAFLFLARVDGKSPAEYITEETDKQVIRRTALQAIEKNVQTFDKIIALLVSEMKLA